MDPLPEDAPQFVKDYYAYYKTPRGYHERAFALLKGENKELMIIPGANHCDLYDGGEGNYIPFDKLQSFFEENLA